MEKAPGRYKLVSSRLKKRMGKPGHRPINVTRSSCSKRLCKRYTAPGSNVIFSARPFWIPCSWNVILQQNSGRKRQSDFFRSSSPLPKHPRPSPKQAADVFEVYKTREENSSSYWGTSERSPKDKPLSKDNN